MELWIVIDPKESGFTIGCQIGDTRQKSYWSAPPEKIDHVGLEYLRNRYPLIVTEKLAAEFKKQFKELMSEM